MGEEKKVFSKIKTVLYTIYIENDEEKRRRGDDLGIFFYISSWFFVILLFSLSSDEYIRSMNLFYLAFDFICIVFISSFLIERLYSRKRTERSGEALEDDFLEFYDLNQLAACVLFVFTVFWIYWIINRLIEPYMLKGIQFNSSLAFRIFTLFRVVGTEELAFRGLGMFLIVFLFTKVFNNDEEHENFERNEKIIWWFAIVSIGILFGFYHFPKFYDPKTFPYFYLETGGEPIKIHIFYPIFFLSLLGILLGLCRYKYGLIASILLHMVNNYYATAIIYYIYYATIITTTI